MKTRRSHVVVLTMAFALTVGALAWNASTFSDGDVLSAATLNALLNNNFQSLDDEKLDLAGGNMTGPLSVTTGPAAGEAALSVTGNDLDQIVGYFENDENATTATVMVKNQGTGPALSLFSFGEGDLIAAAGDGGSFNVSTRGVVENQVGSGLPVAYGKINATAVREDASTSNVQGVTWDAVNERYVVNLEGVNFMFNDFTTVVTPSGSNPRFATVDSVGGDLLVTLFNTAGAKVQGGFSFVIFRPGY